MKHAVATVRWLDASEGGRHRPVSGLRYMAPVHMDGVRDGCWTLVVNRSREDAQAEETVLVHFLMEDAPHDLLREGAEFTLQEGARTVAEGEVSEAFELSAAA